MGSQDLYDAADCTALCNFSSFYCVTWGGGSTHEPPSSVFEGLELWRLPTKPNLFLNPSSATWVQASLICWSFSILWDSLHVFPFSTCAADALGGQGGTLSFETRLWPKFFPCLPAQVRSWSVFSQASSLHVSKEGSRLTGWILRGENWVEEEGPRLAGVNRLSIAAQQPWHLTLVFSVVQILPPPSISCWPLPIAAWGNS